MNKLIQNLVGDVIQIEVSGKKVINGIIIDLGSDILVLYNGIDYLYIPIVHVKNIRSVDKKEYEHDIIAPIESPSINLEGNLSLRKALTLSKGMFLEIYISGDQPLHGYITGIMNNYFVFYSPIYKTMYITLNHLKWIIPYSNNQRPYGLSNQSLPFQPTNHTLARTFDIQVEKLKDEVVVFNIGENNNAIGKINRIEENVIELQTAKEDLLYLNLQHIKTIYKV